MTWTVDEEARVTKLELGVSGLSSQLSSLAEAMKNLRAQHDGVAAASVEHGSKLASLQAVMSALHTADEVTGDVAAMAPTVHSRLGMLERWASGLGLAPHHAFTPAAEPDRKSVV